MFKPNTGVEHLGRDFTILIFFIRKFYTPYNRINKEVITMKRLMENKLFCDAVELLVWILIATAITEIGLGFIRLMISLLV